MTIGDVINRVDELAPNQYSEEQKIRWLTGLDGKIFAEIILTHQDPVRESFSAYEDTSCELLVPFPYAEDLYSWYLQAMIAAQNAESAKFEQLRVLYNDALKQFQDWYNRTHRPIGGARFWF